jgi:alpha-tubulin suppressor-like RCC1 family protein
MNSFNLFNSVSSFNLAVSLGALVSSQVILTAAPPGTVVSWGQQVLPYVEPGTRYAKITAGEWYNLALKPDGTLVAWGWGADGACNMPGGLNNVTAIAAGGAHGLALKADGIVVA